VVCNLCLKTHKTLHSIRDVDFQSLEYIVQGKYVKFNERESKNHKVQLLHCHLEKVRKAIAYRYQDLVATDGTYTSHL
jgi:hypothetical protein